MTTVKTKTKVIENSAVDSVSKMSITVMGIASALVGFWAVACLAGALVSQGPVDLIKSWFTAIGM